MTAYLSLGSNLGDRMRNLAEAVERLRENGVAVVQQSSFYETEPQDFRDQPWFLNIAVEASVACEPEDLLRAVLVVEAAMGRVRVHPKGPRLIDIDILLWDDLIYSSAALEIPHPRMTTRRFVLEPLVEIAPDLRDPRTGELFQAILSRLEGQTVLRRKGSNRDADAP